MMSSGRHSTTGDVFPMMSSAHHSMLKFNMVLKFKMSLGTALFMYYLFMVVMDK